MNGMSTVYLDGDSNTFKGETTHTHTGKESERDRQIYRQRQSVTESERGRQIDRERVKKT